MFIFLQPIQESSEVIIENENENNNINNINENDLQSPQTITDNESKIIPQKLIEKVDPHNVVRKFKVNASINNNYNLIIKVSSFLF